MKRIRHAARRRAGAIVRRLLPLPIIGPLLVILIRLVRPETSAPAAPTQASDHQIAQLRDDMAALTRAVERLENALYLQQIGTLTRADLREPRP